VSRQLIETLPPSVLLYCFGSLQGLLRMSLLERLCYLVDKCRPQPAAVIEILEIIMRVARHSMQSAYKVCVVPR
jgi:RNA polymerase II-associated protein 1